ncbi:uncharacterized protein BDV14DRAFT_207299 [Aspergillus stella-maris]|uniref:uncharacterized protein n=1 Tax=Aspergillus stella-maris TaxID=1810926 RepID=UPI003CCE3769
MARPVTQIYPDLFQTKRAVPPVPAPTKSQGPRNHRLAKGLEQSARQEPSDEALLDHTQDFPQSSRQGEGVTVQLPGIRRGSPWGILKKLFTCDLAGPVSVTVHAKNPSKVITVRALSNAKADKWLQVLQQTQHPNVISAREIFEDHKMTYFIVDDYPLTLKHLVACDPFPSELQLASILVQHCVMREPNQSHTKSLRALANITMLLMQKYLKPDGVIGIDSTRWQSEPLEFLSATGSVATVQDLRKHSLLTKHRWSTGTLAGLARLCLLTTHTFITKPWSQQDS